MKSLTIIAMALTISTVAQANITELSIKNVTVNVDLSTARVRLSEAGYSSPVLKVLIPELAGVTILDHRNEGEAAPCMATFESMNVDDVIQGNPSTEKVDLTIKLSRLEYINQETQLCEVSLDETIQGNIRGLNFTHNRSVAIGTRHIDDCNANM